MTLETAREMDEAEENSHRNVAAAKSPLRLAIAEFAKDPIAVAALGVFVMLVAAAIFAPIIAPTDPYDLMTVDIMNNLLPPGSTSFDGFVFLLGTDGQGRDILSAILYGLRTSLWVALTSGSVAVVIGVSLGLVAGYAGGLVDIVIMRLVDLQMSFPSILVALVLLAVLGQGVDKVILALVIVQWAYYCRTVRSSAMVESKREYIEAARSLALSNASILFRHILPNCMSPIIVITTVQVAHAIALEATLSFLGLGVPPTEPSLGLLIANGFNFVLSGDYWISVFPGVALLFTIISINLVADRIRDVLNPRLRA